MENEETFPLDEAMIGLVNEYREHTAALNGALVLFCRQQGLIGVWRVAPNGREIVCVQQMQSQQLDAR